MPEAGRRPLSRWRAAVRLMRVLLHLLRGLFTVAILFPRLSLEQREIRVQDWSARMLACMGVSLRVDGPATLSGPLLIVANHSSWLDITALHAARFCRFVSKADVQSWPLIGTLASGIGTLFIERASRRDTLRVVQHMADSLRAGDVLAVFPEGTTGDGRELLPFHANLLQAAIVAEAPVQPVALRFIDRASGAPSLAPCYVGEDTMLDSIWRTLRTPGVVVEIIFGVAQQAQGRDRRVWAAELRAEVQRMRQPPVTG